MFCGFHICCRHCSESGDFSPTTRLRAVSKLSPRPSLKWSHLFFSSFHGIFAFFLLVRVLGPPHSLPLSVVLNLVFQLKNIFFVALPGQPANTVTRVRQAFLFFFVHSEAILLLKWESIVGMNVKSEIL